MEDLKISFAAARVNTRMTQKEAAKKLKVSNKTLVNWERGTTSPTFAKVQEMSDLYGVPVANLVANLFMQ